MSTKYSLWIGREALDDCLLDNATIEECAKEAVDAGFSLSDVEEHTAYIMWGCSRDATDEEYEEFRRAFLGFHNENRYDESYEGFEVYTSRDRTFLGSGNLAHCVKRAIAGDYEPSEVRIIDEETREVIDVEWTLEVRVYKRSLIKSLNFEKVFD